MSNIITAGNATNNGTSISSDTSGVLELKTGSTPTTAIAVDASQNVGIGTSSPRFNLSVGSGSASSTATPATIDLGGTYSNADGANAKLRLYWDGTNTYGLGVSNTKFNYIVPNDGNHVWYNTTTERMRITSAGRVCINTTYADTQLNIAYNGSSIRGVDINNTVSSNQDAIYFRTNGSNVGRINTDASNTSYVTSSDYRLKENIAPMVGALDKVAALKPCTYTWKVDGSDGQGFIAHELQAVVPQCVSGEKDAVNEDGSIKPQGIDTSFLVATLTAAIQELKAELDATKAEVAALKGA